MINGGRAPTKIFEQENGTGISGKVCLRASRAPQFEFLVSISPACWDPAHFNPASRQTSWIPGVHIQLVGTIAAFKHPESSSFAD